MGKHVEAKLSPRPRRPKRRRLMVAFRAGMLAAAILAVLYATLPWWVPTRYLAGKLARDLSRQLSLPVKIERMEMSWSEGITISEVRIGNRSEFGGGDMAVVKTLRCDLSPLHLLWKGKLKWMELTGAELRVVVREDGQVNVAALKPLMDRPPPERLAIRAAAATVQFPRNDQLLRLDVADLQYRTGRLENIGRITMSAVLAQSGQGAPVTLMASAGGKSEKDPAAAGSFRFTGVDISQLNLPTILSLPLKRLAGRASGQMDCRVNRSGMVERFSLALYIKDLDAQPRQGPTLPVIKQAEISLAVTSDPIHESIDARTFHLRLPGIDLKGAGQIHADALAGHWEGVRRLDVTGTVNPTTIAALFSDRPAPLPGGIEVDGDVKVVRLSLRGDESQMSLSVVLDATAAAMRSGPRTVKTAGKKLTAELAGNLEKHTWRFSVDQAKLRIGQNLFLGSGQMQNIRRPSAGLDWRGSWEVADLESLRDLLTGISAGRCVIPQDVSLTGQIKGRWRVGYDPDIRAGTLALQQVRLPAGTHLTVGKWFVKPPAKPMEMELSAALASDPPSISRLRFWAGIGRAGVSIEEGQLTFLEAAGSLANGADAEAICLRAKGRYSVRGIGELLDCIPAAAESNDWKNRFSGSLAGKLNAILSPSMRRVHIEANATQLKVDIGETFLKTAGQPAEIIVDFQADDALPAARRNRLAVRVGLAAAVMDANLIFPAVKAAEAPVLCYGRLRVADAAWLRQSTFGGTLAETLRQWDVRGSMSATFQAEINDDSVAGELTCDADDIRFRLHRASSSKIKPRGEALRLRLAGRIDKETATIKALSLDVGQSSVTLTGAARLAAVRPEGSRRAERPAGNAGKIPPAKTYWPPPGLASTDLKVRGRLVLDSTAKALLPELAEWAKSYGISGAVRLAMRVQGDDKAINASGQLDASGLTVAFKNAPDAADAPAADTSPLKDRIDEAIKDIIGQFRKAGGAEARARFELTVPADFSRLRVRDLFIAADAFQLRASATLPLLETGGRAAHIALSIPDLRRLCESLPRLASYRPTGAVLIEGQFQHRDGLDVLEYGTVKADNAAVTIRGKRCRVDGTVLAEEVAPATPEGPAEAGAVRTAGRVATDSLEFSIGQNHGFIVADLQNPTKAPAGRIALLCTNLDTHDLQRWAEGETTPTTTNAELTEADIKGLGRRADETIADIRRLLSAANLHCRVQIDRLRYFDPKVRAFYEPRGMIAEAEVKKGRILAGYRCSLNGGNMEQKYSLNLNTPEARVAHKADLRELLTGENILAQVAQEFPGNTVYGTFSQSKEVTFSLRDLVMSEMDVRYRAIPVGKARTVAVDGMLRGKGAPRFVTHFFPGLNLTTYRYRKMTGFAEYAPDGTASNDMIFSGAAYDIYMTGTTDAKNIAQYNIGVILLAAPQSPEFNHTFRQGRVLVLKFKARIKDGRFYDEVVTYPWPTETAYKIFLENNIIYRLWLNAAKKPDAAIIADEPAK